MMIETTAQALAAVDEIKQLTGWPDAEIARRTGLSQGTLNRIKTRKMKWPSVDTRKAIAEVLIYARTIKPTMQ
jgi:transcriptional regulator with XRE-family HTH domain